jgi:dCMP deaminase
MRTDRINWDDHHMLQALVTSMRSPDPSTQVGAYIVDTNNRPLGSGYNGLPKGIHPHQISWEREAESPLDTKYPYILHAERNAIHNATRKLEGGALYVTLYPCNECALDIIQKGIRKVVYLDNKYEDEWFTKAAAWMFDQVDIEVRQHVWQVKDPKRYAIFLSSLLKSS